MARYALIIGIAEYTGSFQSLETPVQNANAIADILDRYGEFDQVRRLPFRREAGQKDLGKVIRKPLPNALLVRELQQFLQEAVDSDVLIYYSGHGFTKLDPLSQTSEGYLAPSDCQVEVNAAGQATVEKNGISLNGLNALINQHKFSSLVVILDCCNSGAFLESSVVQRNVTAFGYERNYYLITACRAERQAYEGNEYSLLTAAVLKGLSSENASPASGWVSGDRLFDVIGNELQNSRQEPLRMGWGRLVRLVQYPQQAESAAAIVHPFNADNPYMGLKAFEQNQADYFFGREQAVRALLDRLADHRFLAVIGPSGCGKSSLVRAGLLPELEGDRIPGSHAWQIEIITPGQYPLQVLTNALERHQADNKPVVLLVDQFEELFTLCSNEEDQRTFIKWLNDETNDPTKQTRIIVAMRGDFLDRCAKFQEAAELINSTAPTTYMVIPLTEAKLVAELEDSITCPAALHGVNFEDGLVARIVDDVVNQPGAMPLLQYALLQLWNHCIAADRPSRRLTLQSYEAIDGVKGALQRWADQFYTSLSPTDQAFVQKLISKLVHIGDGNEVNRRRASWEELRSIASQDQLDRIIGRLVYQRLLVADDQTVEVAHEALLSESKLIQGWIEENRDSIRQQQRLEIYRREWQEHDRSENYLLDAGRLAAIDEWIEKKQNPLMPIDQEFIEKSRERRDRQFQAQLDQERKLREEAEGRELAEIEKKIEAEARVEAESERTKEAIARVKAEKRGKQLAIAAAACITVISALAGFQWRTADRGQIEAQTQFSKAAFRLNRSSLNTLIEALKAGKQLQQSIWFRNDPQLQAEVMEALGQASYWVREHNRLEGHTNSVQQVSFSPDGQIIATASYDNTAKLWSLNGKELKTLLGHTQAVTDISFSPDGKTIATASHDRTVKLWNQNGQLLQTLSGHLGRVWRVRFSPDGQTVATASADKTTKLWKLDGTLLNTWKGHGGEVYSVSFSPDGQIVATAGADQTIILWDRKAGKPIRTLKGHSALVYSVSFSPDGREIISASADKTAILWARGAKNREWARNTIIRPFVIGRHEAEVVDARFSPDGQTIATASLDSTVKLWNREGILLDTLEGHLNPLNGISFNPDGSILASASNDKTIKLWQLNPSLKTLAGHGGNVNSVAFSPDGQRIATAGIRGAAKLWKQDGKFLINFKGHSTPIYSITFSPDSQIVATASDDKTVKLWRQDGTIIRTIMGHTELISSINFSPNGQMMATTSADTTAKLWTLEGKLLDTLRHNRNIVYSASFSPDSEAIATADSGGEIRLWNRNGTLLRSWKGHTAPIFSIAFSPDGQLLATSSEDKTIKLWNTNLQNQDGKPLRTLEGHTAAVWSVRFSPDSQMIATASDDKTVKLWTRDGRLTTTLTGHRGEVNSLSFSPNGKSLVTASSDKTALLWNIENLNLKSLMIQDCGWIHDYLRTHRNSLTNVCKDSS